MIAMEQIVATRERIHLHSAREAQPGAESVTEERADQGACHALMLDRHGVAGYDLGARDDEIDGEGRQEHGWEGHGPVGQMGGDGGQEGVHGYHCETGDADDDLGRDARGEPGG